MKIYIYRDTYIHTYQIEQLFTKINKLDNIILENKIFTVQIEQHRCSDRPCLTPHPFNRYCAPVIPTPNVAQNLVLVSI